jgi:formate--tetrahydrofolate ligase
MHEGNSSLKPFFVCKKRTKKTFALRRGWGEAGVSLARLTPASPHPRRRAKVFCALFYKKALLTYKPRMTSDIEIARNTRLRPIEEIAAKLDIPPSALYRYGPYKGKLDLGFAETAMASPRGRLVLVTAISPTPAGEGKTTTTIGLGDALNAAGARTAICLREPSLGPCFGAKGGATGGGRAQVAPMEEINLHFTGDLHAITAAHNLLAAMADNTQPPLHRLTWRRALDVNDRALRDIVTGIGSHALRQTGFDITAASEVMAIFCLATSLADLQARLSRMIVGQDAAKNFVTAGALKAVGAMSVLLKDALAPNLVQTLEGTPAFVHGGPFANIAHGCNSVIATKTALGLADIVVTEAGFGADLGAEKFFDIKCRQAGLTPAATVVVATVRALKMHGGVALADLSAENPGAVTRGAANLKRHVENMRLYGMPVIVALNHFDGDTPAEIAAVTDALEATGTRTILCRHWAQGAAGAATLAETVISMLAEPASFALLYPDDLSLKAKIETIAQRIYRARAVEFAPAALKKLNTYTDAGFGDLPVCMAKTQYSFSADPARRGAPDDVTLPVRDVRLSAGAGFVVALCGDIMTMPGLPKRPAAEQIGLDGAGQVTGLS